MVAVIEPVTSEMFETCDVCQDMILPNPMRIFVESEAAYHANPNEAMIYATEHTFHPLDESDIEARALAGVVTLRARLSASASVQSALYARSGDLDAAALWLSRANRYLEEARHPVLPSLGMEVITPPNAKNSAQPEPVLPGDGQAAVSLGGGG